MDGCIFRRATPDDKEGILNILPGDLYWCGFDYLPASFDYRIHSKFCESFVCILQNEIVAFTSLLFIDDGDAVVSVASRVKPSFQRQGIYSRLTKYAHQSSDRSRKATRRLEIVAMNRVCCRSLTKQLYKRPMLLELKSVYFSAKNLPTFTDNYTSSLNSVFCVNLVHLAELFDDKNTCERLFPDNRVFVDWVPYKLQESNVRLFADDQSSGKTCVFIDLGVIPNKTDMAQHVSTTTTQSNINETHGNDRIAISPSGLSIGAPRKGYSGLRYEIHFYGNDDLLKEHLIRHLIELKKLVKTDENILLGFLFHMSPSYVNTGQAFFNFMDGFGIDVSTKQDDIVRVYEKSLL